MFQQFDKVKLLFSIQHSHSSALNWKAEHAGPKHLQLQLDPRLPDCENPFSLEHHLQQTHTEPPRLCAQPTAVY